MVDSSLVRGCTAENLGLPGVKMGIKMNYRDFAISGVDRAQDREDDSVVTPESDQARVMLAILRDRIKSLAGDRIVSVRREGGAMKESPMTILDLFDSMFVVVRRHRNVTTVHYFQTG